jgi:3D-(3,5/4)-trihydroxycyclohexane-1,2-dione acylhydrolase (decyclizing)
MVSTGVERSVERAERGATRRLTVAQAVVEYLQVQYSERDGRRRRMIPAMWGIFGHGNVAGLGQALDERGRDLPYYQPFNEQSMVHTALGYARANLRLATLACTSSIGPGATNMVTGAATATINRLPVLLLPSDYYATRHQGPVLQQLEHPVSADLSVNDCFRPVSRFFDRISRPEQLLTALPEAMRVLTDPVETGAVTIALPQDVQAHAYDFPVHFLAERSWRVERRPPDRQRIGEAAQLIARAERPLIIAGGGVHYAEAWDELRALAEAVGAPVVETFAGRGAIREASPWLLGGGGVTGTGAAGRIARDADLVIAVGTRLTDFTTGSQSAFQHPEVRFVNVNVAPHDAHKQGALPIVADAKLALAALTEAARAAGRRPRPAYLEEVRAAWAAWEETLRSEVFVRRPSEAMSQGELIGVVNRAARPGDTAIAAAGGLPGDLQKLWDATGGRTLHLEFGYSCMGYELPAGLGVRMAMRQRGQEGEVYVLIGDGTYLMQPSELATAVQEGLKVTLVLSNNHGYQIIRNLQMGRVGRSFGNEFRGRDHRTGRLEGAYLPIDFAKNGQSFGARVWKVETPDGLKRALEAARTETGPCMIVVETEPHRYLPGSGVWWDVAPAETTDDPTTRSLREEFEQSRDTLQRLHY